MADPYFSVKTPEKIDLIQISPHEWSKNLVCIAYDTTIKVALLQFQEEFDNLEQEIQLTWLEEFFHRPRVHCLSWSPSSNVNALPKIIEFCAAGNDCSLRIFTANLTAKHSTTKEIQGHEDYINDCSYDPDGEYIVSVSDDATCKLWSIGHNYKLVHSFQLMSPGMSVSWLPEEPGKFLVGEKKGLFRLYNSLTYNAILSVHCSPSPLMASIWASNIKSLIFLAAGKLHKADLMTPGHSVVSCMVHPGGGFKVSACPANENYVATIGRPNESLKVTNLKNKLTIFCTNLEHFGGFSWHSRLPILCVANNSRLCFYRISPK